MSMVVLSGWVLFFKALCVDVRNVLVFDLVIFMQTKANFKVQLWNRCVKSSVVEDRCLFLHVAGLCSKSSVSGVTLQVVTLEDVVEEIVGEIFDENDSKVCHISARWCHRFCLSVYLWSVWYACCRSDHHFLNYELMISYWELWERIALHCKLMSKYFILLVFSSLPLLHECCLLVMASHAHYIWNGQFPKLWKVIECLVVGYSTVRIW